MMNRIVWRLLRPLLTSLALVALAIAVAFAWGSTGHKIINRTAVRHLPPAMSAFASDSAFYEAHASDADIRRVNSDTSFYAEWARHFIDIDDYPNFQSLPRDLNAVIALYGWERVKQNGINPWVTAWLTDTLTEQLRQGALAAARQTMSDLGHYVGDAHQPLHVTANYNGQLSGNNGIHSRYESTMLNGHQGEIAITRDTARYIDSPLDFAFGYLYESNSHVDSILIADSYAKTVSGGLYNTAYYDALWQRTGGFTKRQIQSASVDLASIWYTAWVNAGLSTDVGEALAALPASLTLHQNYPNPFNPVTRFVLDLGERAAASLTVYDAAGREIATLIDANLPPGTHEVGWDASGCASGIYFYALRAGSQSRSGKMVLMR